VTHPATALWNELVKAVAIEVARIQNEQPRSPEGLIPVAKAAQQASRTTRTVKNWCKAGLLKDYRIRGNWYLGRAEWDEFLSRTGGRRRKSQLKVA
jgi:hypothetical protein